MNTANENFINKIADDGDRLLMEAPKLHAAILFFVSQTAQRLNRISLCKHLYYSDGHFYQKYSRPITELEYLHIEGSPQPVFFNEIIHEMIINNELEIVPSVVTEDTPDGKKIMVLKGHYYRAKMEPQMNIFSREERKVLNSMLFLFKGDLTLETRYYPNLYQQYTQTGLYEKIEYKQLPELIRPHLSWKAWASKVFRLLWQ